MELLKGRGRRMRRKRESDDDDDAGDDDVEAVVEDGVGVPKGLSALSVTGTLYLCPNSVTSICWMYGTLDELYLLFEYMRSKYRRLL